MSTADGKGSSVAEMIGPAAHGELQGSASALQCPDIPCKGVIFKARADNAGSVFIGLADTVTVADGTTDTTTGYGLSAGDSTGYWPCSNVNQFWRISTNAGDDLTYMTFK